MKKFFKLITLPIIGLLLISAVVFTLGVETTLEDFFMPGSQPGQSGNLETPNKCDNCHGGYDKAVEPAFNWRGSMMAQAMRDPLYFASVAIANQDAPESGDLCIRCHAPDGWLNGRSTPTDGSALNNNDFQGVQCDFCHKLVKPTNTGVNPFSDDSEYTNLTYPSDQEYLQKLTEIPPQSGNGMYIVHDANAKRGPFEDAAAKHQMNYSPFHSESDLCATCHDVSNPAFVKTTKNEDGTFNYEPNAFNTPSELFDTYTMFPVERTFSEWKMSEYAEVGVASEVFEVYDASGTPSNIVSTCQDCHMRDVAGYGANKRRIPFRHNLPLHDMTGGNTFVPGLVAQLYPEEVDAEALLEGVQRATFMLQNAATMEVVPEGVDGVYTGATVIITNQTGHKLPSGYPEGRRMWIQIKAYNGADLIFESGNYNTGTAVLTKDEQVKIYEAKLAMSDAVKTVSGLSNDEDGSSFHFVLNNKVIKDNRIPPRGFTNANFEAIQSPPVGYTYTDGQFSDATAYNFGSSTADRIEVKLLYQTTSKEYVTFLRDENNAPSPNAGDIMYELWETNGKSAPVVMEEESIGGTVTPPNEDLPVFVDNIGFVTGQTAKGGKTLLTATVTVVDDGGASVEGAVVTGQFSGPTNTSVIGTTDGNGQVVFTTSSKKVNDPWCLGITAIDKEGYAFTTNVQYCQSESAKIQFQENDRELVVYPNPANEVLKINVYDREVQKVEIFSFSGALVKTIDKKQFNNNYGTINLNTSELKSGNYLVRIHYNNEFETRMVKVK